MEAPRSYMYKSLCGDDFYPLIYDNTRYMSHDEKVAYRVENDIPNTVDKWIEEEKIHTEKPTAKPYDRNAPSAYASLQDNVECILNVTREVVSVPNCRVLQCVIDFQPQLGLDGLEIRTSIIFTLTLQVCIPPTTGFLMHYWHSPAVIIDQYTEDNLDNLSPNWLETVRTKPSILAEPNSHVGNDALLCSKHTSKFQAVETSHSLVQCYVGQFHSLVYPVIFCLPDI